MNALLMPRQIVCVALVVVAGWVATGDAWAKPDRDRRPPAEKTGLSDVEKQNLSWMYNEEKIAHDVYTKLGEKWGSRVFANISGSEARHMEAVAGLLQKYGLPNATMGMPVGQFADARAQALYDQLLSQGLKSQRSAMEVGVKIEKLDITDLEAAITRTGRSDIKTVYTNLLNASKNHLRAFTRQIDRRR
jgi:hypothetical protein